MDHLDMDELNHCVTLGEPQVLIHAYSGNELG